MQKANRFGRGGCYTCVLCGKKTRDAGGNAARQVCSACYDLGDIEVEIWDGVITKKEGIRQAAKRLGVPEAQVKWGKHGFNNEELNMKKQINSEAPKFHKVRGRLFHFSVPRVVFQTVIVDAPNLKEATKLVKEWFCPEQDGPCGNPPEEMEVLERTKERTLKPRELNWDVSDVTQSHSSKSFKVKK